MFILRVNEKLSVETGDRRKQFVSLLMLISLLHFN